jgi:hypothetical protein
MRAANPVDRPSTTDRRRVDLSRYPRNAAAATTSAGSWSMWGSPETSSPANPEDNTRQATARLAVRRLRVSCVVGACLNSMAANAPDEMLNSFSTSGADRSSPNPRIMRYHHADTGSSSRWFGLRYQLSFANRSPRAIASPDTQPMWMKRRGVNATSQRMLSTRSARWILESPGAWA